MSDRRDRLATRFTADDASRLAILERVRLCASLTKPWVQPPLNQQPNTKLPEVYQSVGSSGVTNLEGKMLLSLFPPGLPWFQLILNPKIRYNPQVDPNLIDQMEQALFLRELVIQSVLESANIESVGARRERRAGFRSRKRMALSQLLITGDVLEYLDDDYRLHVYRRDQYTTKRDNSGEVIYHVIKESVDPMTLTEVQREKAQIRTDDIKDMPVAERMVDLYTSPEWNPVTKKWVICQEIKGFEITESEESVSPYFSTPFELAPGENYGRGFVEIKLGDLRSYDELKKRLLDFAGMCSKMLIVKDLGSEIKDDDFALDTGKVFHGRVTGGVLQDATFFKVDKYPDFKVVYDTAEGLRKDLGKAFLIEYEVTPQKERTTATQVQRVAAELDASLGGMYAPISDDQQLPLLRRVIHQLHRDKLLRPLPNDAVEVTVLTGMAALARQQQASNITDFVQTLASLSQAFPGVMDRIDDGVLLSVLARYRNINEPGMILSDANYQKKQAAAAKQQALAAAQQRAGEVAAETAGAVAQHHLTQTPDQPQ